MTTMERINEKIANYIISTLGGRISNEVENNVFAPEEAKMIMKQILTNIMIDAIIVLEHQSNDSGETLTMEFAHDFVDGFMEGFKTSIAEALNMVRQLSA